MCARSIQKSALQSAPIDGRRERVEGIRRVSGIEAVVSMVMLASVDRYYVHVAYVPAR